MISTPPQEVPKMNLNLSWDNLTKEEKAFFAGLMGSEELAKFEMEAGTDGSPDDEIQIEGDTNA